MSAARVGLPVRGGGKEPTAHLGTLPSNSARFRSLAYPLQFRCAMLSGFVRANALPCRASHSRRAGDRSKGRVPARRHQIRRLPVSRPLLSLFPDGRSCKMCLATEARVCLTARRLGGLGEPCLLSNQGDFFGTTS